MVSLSRNMAEPRSLEPLETQGEIMRQIYGWVRSSPTTSWPTTPVIAGSFRRFRAGTRWYATCSEAVTTPKEHRFLRHLVYAYPEFKVAYTRLVVIATDDQLNTNEFRDALGAEWPFLSDPERTVQRDLHIQEFTDPHNPMIPHTIVLEPDLRIFRIYNGYWYWGGRPWRNCVSTCRRRSRRLARLRSLCPRSARGLGPWRAGPVPRRHARGANPLH